MSNSFIKLNRDSEIADLLAIHHPNAFILLYFIAKRARRTLGSPDGLEIGEAHIGDYEKMGLTERQYRTAKEVLCQKNIVKIIETNRTRKKSTTGTTTKGTKVKLLNSMIWDINIELKDDSKDVRPTTDRRLTDDEQECKNVKNERNNNKEGEAIASVAAADFKKLKEFGFSEENIATVSHQFAIKKLTTAGFQHGLNFLRNKPPQENPPGAFLFAAEKFPPILEKEDPEKNKALAMELEKTWFAEFWLIEACLKEIEFRPKVGCQAQPIIYRYDLKGFKSEVFKTIKQKEFTKLELYKTKQGVVAL